MQVEKAIFHAKEKFLKKNKYARLTNAFSELLTLTIFLWYFSVFLKPQLQELKIAWECHLFYKTGIKFLVSSAEYCQEEL